MQFLLLPRHDHDHGLDERSGVIGVGLDSTPSGRLWNGTPDIGRIWMGFWQAFW